MSHCGGVLDTDAAATDILCRSVELNPAAKIPASAAFPRFRGRETTRGGAGQPESWGCSSLVSSFRQPFCAAARCVATKAGGDDATAERDAAGTESHASRDADDLWASRDFVVFWKSAITVGAAARGQR